MPLLANELHDRPNGYSWSLKRTRAGFEGRKWFYVATDQEREAILADALPRLGDSWDQSQDLRLCVCSEVGPTERVGVYTYIPASYTSLSSVGGGGNEPPKAQGHLDTWCEVRNGVVTQPIWYPVDDMDEPQLDARPILADQGTTRPVVEMDYLVSVAYDLARSQPDLDRFDSLGDPCCTNADAVTFPPILRTAARRIKGPGECLYKGYDSKQEGDLLVITHTISVRSRGEESWKFQWELKNKEGDAIAIMVSKVVPARDWTGLFE